MTVELINNKVVYLQINIKKIYKSNRVGPRGGKTRVGVSHNVKRPINMFFVLF